jgi:mono/diheme cytochrome c family protein
MMVWLKKKIFFSRSRSPLSLCLVWCAGVVLGGCPSDMREQPSFSYQEAPRRHSPPESIPQLTPFSHVVSPASLQEVTPGAQLFGINCQHCHGQDGTGDGPVAGFLPELPANLHAPEIQKKSEAELFKVVTHGEHAMPAFEKFLSEDERWAVVSFVKALVKKNESSDHMTRNIGSDGGRPDGGRSR